MVCRVVRCLGADPYRAFWPTVGPLDGVADPVFKVLRATLNHAVRLALIMSNPTEPWRRPHGASIILCSGRSRKPCGSWTSAAGSHLPYYPVFLAAVATGARLGERLGVRWRGALAQVFGIIPVLTVVSLLPVPGSLLTLSLAPATPASSESAGG